MHRTLKGMHGRIVKAEKRDENTIYSINSIKFARNTFALLQLSEVQVSQRQCCDGGWSIPRGQWMIDVNVLKVFG